LCRGSWDFIGGLVLSSSGYAVFVLLDSVVRLVVS
jgi:tRNA G37 N-methylase TrmD